MTKPVAGIVLVCALAVGLSACGSSDDDQKPRASIAASPTAEESVAAESEDDVAGEEGSSQEGALADYVEGERAALQAMEPQLAEMYSEITVEGIGPDTVSFNYVFVEAIDVAVASEQFDLAVDQLQDVCDTQVFPTMKSMGITESPKAMYTYVNPDGTQIWSKTFEPS